jgi:hypothetical protein
MKKVDKYLYQVNPGEDVTIQITPSINLGQLYTAVLDTTALDKPPDGRYAFKVTKPVGQIHFFAIEFGFLGAPDGAKYRLDINGNSPNNSGPFTASIVNGDPLLDKQFKFEVVQ